METSMTDFTLHTLDTAPTAAKPLLENSQASFGMIPNLHAVMADSPALLEGYQILHGLAQKTAFTPEELTVVWQSINVEHACHYCVPAHTAIANSMKIPQEVIEALRNETAFAVPKLNVLRDTTLEILRERGHLSESQKAAFFEAGYQHQHLLDIVLVLSQKVMSNYVNHLGETPVDAPFAVFSWEKKA
jgi:alkylhydroperoxidase family enzyme